VGINRQLATGLFLAAVFFVLSLVVGGSPLKADWVCLPEVKLDYYYCSKSKPDQDGNCGSVEYQGGKTTYYCNTADPECWTTTAACSSNDVGLGCHAVVYGKKVTCIPNSPGCSRSQCWSYEAPAPTSGPQPTPTPTPTPTPAGPWWQVKDADVQTNGDLRSKVPSGYYFGLPGLGGFPGVAKYGGSTSLSSATVSAKGWLAESAYAPPNNKIQDYSYFRRSENL
jgi:hypothetical protein